MVGIAACFLDAALQALGDRHDRIRKADRRPTRGPTRVLAARVTPFAVFAVVILVMVGVGRSGSGSATSGGSPSQKANGSSGTGVPTTVAVGGERAPAQVRVAVLNGSHVLKAAGTEAITLKGAAYSIVGTGDTALRTGNAVQCVAGFEREAAMLAKRVGNGASVEPFPRTVPASATGADCLVVLGT